MEINVGAPHSLQKSLQLNYRLPGEGTAVFAAKLGLQMTGRPSDAGQPSFVALYDLTQVAGHHLSYVAAVFQADAAISGTGHAIAESGADDVKDGLPSLTCAVESFPLVMGPKPLHALPEKSFHRHVDLPAIRHDRARHPGSQWPERRWQLLRHADGAALFVRDYYLSKDEQTHLINLMRKDMVASTQALETIWLNGRAVWSAMPGISDGLTRGQHVD